MVAGHTLVYVVIGVMLLLALAVCGLAWSVTRRSIRIAERDRLEAESILGGAEPASRRNTRRKARGLAAKIKRTITFERDGRMLKNAGFEMDPTTFAVIRIVIGVLIAGACVTFAGSLGAGVLAGVVCAVLGPELYLRTKVSARNRMFTQQLGAVLPMIAGSLRTGMTFESAIRNVAVAMDDPLRTEFERICIDLRYDISLDEAFKSLAERTGDKDVKRLASIVSISKDSGGKLADLLDIEAKHIQNRIEMRGKIRANASMGRMQALIVGALPPAVWVFAMVSMPEQFQPFYLENPIGWAVLAIVVVMEIAAILIMRKIYNIPIE